MVSLSDPDQLYTFKIYVDGKKMNPCSTGEIDLWGYEDSLTFSERQTRHNSEINHFHDLQANLEKLINFGHILSHLSLQRFFSEADDEFVVIVSEIGSATDNTGVSNDLLPDDVSSAVTSLFEQNDESDEIVQTVNNIDDVIITETPEVMDTFTVVTESVTTFDYNDVVLLLAALQSKGIPSMGKTMMRMT